MTQKKILQYLFPLLLLLPLPASATTIEDVFAPGEIQAFYDFENGAFLDDSNALFPLTNLNSVASSSGVGGGSAADFGSANTNKKLYNSSNPPLSSEFDDQFGVVFFINVTTQPALNTPNTPFQWTDDSTTNKKGMYELQLYNNGGTQQVYIDRVQSGGFDQVGANNTFTAGTWYMLTYNWDGSDIKLYKDTNCTAFLTKASTRTGTNTATGYGTEFRIGRDSVNNRNFSGKIDKFLIVNRPVTCSEISTLYNSGNGLSFATIASAPAIPVVFDTNSMNQLDNTACSTSGATTTCSYEYIATSTEPFTALTLTSILLMAFVVAMGSATFLVWIYQQYNK